MSKAVEIIRKTYAPKVAEFEKRHQRLKARMDARAAAEEAYQQAQSRVPELYSRREALRGSYADALFEEDQQRAKEVQSTRKALDREIGAATKDLEKKRKAFESADFPVYRDAWMEFKAAEIEGLALLDELRALGNEVAGPSAEKMNVRGSTGYGGVIGELGSEIMAAVYALDALAREAHDTPSNMAA